ncbi:glycoside hydrolase family 28 protein [Pelagicoccus mobilis]|uniref:Rhamnogalacturonase A/B/Epimerase-like pectate lyase domain-containing protein n=1 Tax=Pelagicoccus mobilis TaxID=415221 RepID=A0A934RRY3_9BACT|nr:glycosyl hydrolase family 28 protein [Pelagicoccus mobilis]MBK1875293.1 hypothetical protein [Pelagicoccus mobilis]
MNFARSLAASVVALCTLANAKTWNIDDYGATGDAETLNTTAIQNAIDAANKAGGGTVIIDDGVYVSGTILLKDNVTLHVDESAVLLGSENPADYWTIDTFVDATGQERGKCLIGSVDAKNVGISGSGLIDGRGSSFKRNVIAKTMEKLGIDKSKLQELAANRPFLLRFVRSEGIELKDINLRQPAAWTCHFYQCDQIDVDGISIYSHAHKNNDGIDLDSSTNARIQNCDIDAGDDAICIKATSPLPTHTVYVANCRLKSDWGTIKFGTESMGDFRDITIENCTIWDTKGGGIKLLSVDGANISNINIRNISMENVDMPLFIRLGERRRTYRDAPQQPVGSIDNVNITNITAVTRSLDESRVSPPAGVFITGTPNHKIGKVSLKNIDITLPGGGTEEHSELYPAEDEKRYPEFSFFEVLPAYGLYARHIQGLETKNMSFTTNSPDARPETLVNGK